MTPEEKATQVVKEYNDKWDGMVSKGDEAMSIVKRHIDNNIPLDVEVYPQSLRVDIYAALLRLRGTANWKSGRLIDDPGDEDGKPTRERQAPLDTPL